MKVRFSVVEEFLAELEAEQNHVEDSIVRLTYQYEQSKSVPFLYSMSAVAGFVVLGKLVYLKQICGDIMQSQETEGNQKTRQKAEAIGARVEEKAGALNVFVRRGMFEL